ncbi:hypothetical protein BGZ96_002258 [Linnemannia gamsii]|uniref:Uncharacterized protein n=1 Tax=Linnemannia gamsii TaxID=64522 RepID=A0ABQ7KAT5_9FUNG|nr:hypothetical protein BGZ96_002258 [Linnemannia gamsii]
MVQDENESACKIPDIVSVVSASDMLDKLPVAERDRRLCQFPYFGTVGRDGLRELSRDVKNLLLKSVVQFHRDVWLSDDHIDTVLHSIGIHSTGSKTRFFVFNLQFLQGFVDTYSINPVCAPVEHGSPMTHSTDTDKETADTSLEETAESLIENTATPSIKEEGSKDRNQQSTGKKVLKTGIGEKNVKDK